MKQIIFFDGDGTLWYPKETKRNKLPHWVYSDPTTEDDYLAHLVLTQQADSMLSTLKEKGIVIIVLSTHPQAPDEARKLLREKIEHFGISSFVDEFHATLNYAESKGENMLRILSERRIPKKYALMVGDTYEWDYLPAVQNGIDALLMESSYRKEHPRAKRLKRVIQTLEDINSYL